MFHKTTRFKKMTALSYKEAMASAEIDQNRNNIPPMLIPMPLQLPLLVPLPMQFPIMLEFAMDPLAPYHPNPNIGAGMPLMMPPMVGIGGAVGSRLMVPCSPI